MYHKNLSLLFCVFLLYGYSFCHDQVIVPISEKGERHIVVVIASYNNRSYCRRNLESVFLQQYDNYHVVFIDDYSSDENYFLSERHVRRKGMKDKVIFIHNHERRGALANQYRAIHEYCLDTDLVVILDGDDWLLGRDVFSYLNNNVYSDSTVWLTYGQFKQYPTRHRGWCVAMPSDVVANNTFRDYVHSPGHLRTFYAGLFKQIKKEDLMYEGDFFRMTGDLAFMFPMIEMARNGHFKFIQKVLMAYNIGNPLNDHKVVKGLQRQLDLVIRSRSRYDVIETPFISAEA